MSGWGPGHQYYKVYEIPPIGEVVFGSQSCLVTNYNGRQRIVRRGTAEKIFNPLGYLTVYYPEDAIGLFLVEKTKRTRHG